MKITWPLFATALFAALFTLSCSRTDESEPAAQVAEEHATPATAVAETVPQAQAHPGEAPYLAHCASCHDKVVYKAPSRLFIGMTGPQNILDSMNGGMMSEQATGISAADRRAIAEFLTGQNMDELAEARQPPACDAEHGFDVSVTPHCNRLGDRPWKHSFPAGTDRQTDRCKRTQAGSEVGICLSKRHQGAFTACLRWWRHLFRQPGWHGAGAGCKNRMSALEIQGARGSAHRHRHLSMVR